MGKKAGGKGKDKAGKGAGAKPASMSDDDWALYNNFENLLQNLRGNCVFNTIFCSISRATAALWLWQHAASAKATRQKLVEIMIVPHAIAAFKQVRQRVHLVFWGDSGRRRARVAEVCIHRWVVVWGGFCLCWAVTRPALCCVGTL